jgi:hypothetical protein
MRGPGQRHHAAQHSGVVVLAEQPAARDLNRPLRTLLIEPHRYAILEPSHRDLMVDHDERAPPLRCGPDAWHPGNLVNDLLE